MANKNDTYTLVFTLRDSSENRYIAQDESNNITISQSIDGANFSPLSATISPVLKSGALTGVYKATVMLGGNTVAFLIEHPTLYPYPDCYVFYTEQGKITDIKTKTDQLTFTVDAGDSVSNGIYKASWCCGYRQ